MSPEEYAANVLIPGYNESQYLKDSIFYGAIDEELPESCLIHIIKSHFFDNYSVCQSKIPKAINGYVDGWPVLFGTNLVLRTNGIIKVHADVIATTYFLATDYESRACDRRDDHNRFLASYSVLSELGLIDRPLIDEIRLWLCELAVNNGLIYSFPERGHTVNLSHDVDLPFRYPTVKSVFRTTISSLLGRQSFKNVSNSISCYFNFKKDPYDTFDELIRLYKVLKSASKVESNFILFLRADNESTYPLGSKKIQRLLEKFNFHGATIGLHTGYKAGERPELIREEKLHLESCLKISVQHNRNHYLRWANDDYASTLAKLGVEHDYSVGFADHAGFRLGTFGVIDYFDPVRLELVGLKLHPLHVMDCSLSDSRYMSLGENNALEHLDAMLTLFVKYGGELNILWHNQNVAESSSSYHRSLYNKFIECIKERFES